jgi:ATP-dependent helicase HrpA
VGVRVFATAAEAAAAQRRGLVRLLRLVMAKDLKPLRKDLAVNVQGELVYRGLTAHPLLDKDLQAGRDLRDDLMDCLVAAVFLEGQPDIRTAEALQARVTTRRGGIGLPAQEISRSVQSTLESLGAAQAKLRDLKLPAVREDLQRHLSRLVSAGFVLVTPWARLREFPRYLKAVVHRLEKAPQDPARDAKLLAEANAAEERYWQAVKAERGHRPPGEDVFRWLLEEQRVSLFAQHLRTPVTVSAKRIADAWQQRGV